MTATTTPIAVPAGRKPTTRQVYYMARLALAALEIRWPESINDVSDVIVKLKTRGGEARG